MFFRGWGIPTAMGPPLWALLYIVVSGLGGYPAQEKNQKNFGVIGIFRAPKGYYG